MAACRSGSVMIHRAWVTSSLVQVRASDSSDASSSVRPGAGDRAHTCGQVGAVARRRLSRSDLALGVVCSWGRIAPSSGRDSSRAPNTPVVCRAEPLGTGIRHAVHVEGGLVPGEGAVSDPLFQAASGLLVGLGVGAGQVDGHHVAGVLGGQMPTPGLVDDVVGRSGDGGQVDARGVVAQAAEGTEGGHPPVLADDPCHHDRRGVGARSRRRDLARARLDPRRGRGGDPGCSAGASGCCS